MTLNLALIYGSAREGRFCDTVAGWAESRILRHGNFVLDIIDPALIAPAQPEHGRPVSMAAVRQRLARADAFVVVVPEYNHSFPAPLKSLIDAESNAWQAKPVGFVSYGGISGGVRAVEQLRLVFAELHAVGIRNAVGFINAWEQFDDRGMLRNPERADGSMAAMLEQLRWWASALRQAREAIPYDQVA